MSDIKIDKEDWASFLSWVTNSLSGARAEIDVLSLDVGAQIEARSLPLFGLAYDRKSDLIEVALEGLDHLIGGPVEMTATDDDDRLVSIRIVDKDGVTQIIKLTRPLGLPSPPAWRRDAAKHRMGKHA